MIATVEIPGFAQAVTVADYYAYLATGTSGVQVIDIANPTAPFLLARLRQMVKPGTSLYKMVKSLL